MRRLFLPLLPAVAALVAASPASSSTAPLASADPAVPDAVPGEVIVGFEDDAGRSRIRDEAGVRPEEGLGPDAQEVKVVDGESVAETIAELRDEPGVAYAVPNYTTQVAAMIPDDPGYRTGAPGDWRKLQWNFDGPAGVRAPAAWSRARNRGAPGGSGATVAVLDSGAAYLNKGRYKRSPDLSGKRWVEGRDYVDGDRKAYDENDDSDREPNYGMGHGTHVTSTIREATNNGRAVTGLAYRAKVMPVRVLDVNGYGDTSSLVRGIRFAAKRRVDVINVSLQVSSVSGSGSEPIADAVRYAHRRGAVIVAAAGNHSGSQSGAVSAPASLKHVIAVSATTDNGCAAEYSNSGNAVDIAAPGGGDDAVNPLDLNCTPAQAGRSIFQLTWDCNVDRRKRCNSFGLSRKSGTSMAAPHVAAAAAMLIASGRLGNDPSPEAVEQRLEQTARDLGPGGHDDRYGAGLLDAAGALGP